MRIFVACSNAPALPNITRAFFMSMRAFEMSMGHLEILWYVEYEYRDRVERGEKRVGWGEVMAVEWRS